MPKISVVAKIREKQKSGEEVKIVRRRTSESLADYLRKMREDADQRLTSKDFKGRYHSP